MTIPKKNSDLPRHIAYAVAIHALLGLALVAVETPARGKKGVDFDTESLVLLRLPPPAEGEGSVLPLMGEMPASNEESPNGVPGISNNVGEETVARPAEKPLQEDPEGISLPQDIKDELAEERKNLEEELRHLKETSLAPLPQTNPLGDNGPPKPSTGLGDQGAIRELDMDGHSPQIVSLIMARYDMRIETKRMKGTAQNFLSSASDSGGKYFGGMSVPEGIYEVWQLSRKAVAKMATLEEDAIIERGMKPEKTRVVRIVYGIVKTSESEYDLGVLHFEAEPIN